MKEPKSGKKTVICIIAAAVILLSACLFFMLSGKGGSGQETGSQDSVRAADPMTEEEIEADDSDGCIEDS